MPEVLDKAAMRLAEVAPAWQSLVAEATPAAPSPPPPAPLLPNPGPEALQSPGLPQAECEGKSEDKQRRALQANTLAGARKRPHVQAAPVPATVGYVDSDSSESSPPWSEELAALLAAWGRDETRAAARAWAEYAPRLAAGGFETAEFKARIEAIPVSIREALDVHVKAERVRPPRRLNELIEAYCGIFAAADLYWKTQATAQKQRRS